VERQNVTIAVPKELLKQAKHLAVERGTSLSGLLSEFLEQLVGAELGRQKAAERMKRSLARGLDRGTNGRCSWTRESVHERR